MLRCAFVSSSRTSKSISVRAACCKPASMACSIIAPVPFFFCPLVATSTLLIQESAIVVLQVLAPLVFPAIPSLRAGQVGLFLQVTDTTHDFQVGRLRLDKSNLCPDSRQLRPQWHDPDAHLVTRFLFEGGANGKRVL